MGMTVVALGPNLAKLVLEGRLDAAAVGQLELPFTAQVSASRGDVLVDLTRLGFCASLGLRLFIANARVVQRRGRRIVLFGAQPAVAEVFETVALDTLMPIVATEAAALALLAA